MPAPRVLVTHGSIRGGTAEIAEMIATVLRERGLAVDCLPAAGLPEVKPYDAVIVGGALYMMRWQRHARRFVRRNAAALRERAVWLFSSGPLDASALRGLPPVRSVATLMRSIGARGHATFGGRLKPDASGFIASKMAKKMAGDWRDRDQIRRWATDVATTIITPPQDEPRVVAARPAYPRTARMVLALTCLAAGLAVLLYAPAAGVVLPGVILLFVIGAATIAMATALQRSRA